jgi:PAS domain S-box-containing protein
MACIIAIVQSISYIIMMQGVVSMEQKTARQNTERLHDALSKEISGLDAIALDWAAWDDTYAFIQSNGTNYIKSNLVDETFTNLRLNFMLFLNSSDQVIFGKALDLLNETEIPVPQSLLGHISANDFLLRHENTTSGITGLILLAEGPILVASQPILTSEGKGPIRGTLIIGRFLDSAEINRLTEITHLPVLVQLLDGSPMDSNFQVANAHLSKGESVFVQPLNREMVVGYAFLEDIYGNPILILRFDIPRDFYAQGLAGFIYSFFAMAALSVVFGGMTMLLLEKFVLSRLSRFSTDVSNIGKSCDFTARVSVAEKDDLSDLAGEINRMLSALGKAEEKLSALNFYGRSLNVANNMKEIYRLTLDAMQKVLGFEYADLMMIDRNMLRIIDQRGYPKPFSLELSLDGSNRGITIRAVRTGNPVLIADIRKDKDFVEGLPGVLSELAVPIKIEDRVLGVLNVESKKLDAFSDKDQELVEILASHAATAISNLDRAKSLETYAREIRESQQKFERLFTDNPEAAVYMDSSFHILDINPRFSELFGYSLGETKGKHINDVIVPEDKREEGEMLDREALKKGHVYHDTVRKRKDGSLVPVSISAAPIAVEGKLVGTVGLYKDFTERKQMEKKLEEYSQHLEELVENRTKQLRETQEQLIRSERLVAMGQVAAMVGHDLRNPLTSIAGATYYLKTKLRSNANQKIIEMLELIEKDIEHSNNIITDLLDYSRDIHLEMVKTDVESIMKDALSLVTFPKNIQVSDFSSLDSKIVVDVEKMKRVFVNIIKNAVDAMPKGGTITITSQVSDGWLNIAFTDTGTGISKDVMQKLFAPLFTTKARGMGLGLPICKRIVEAHMGKISVESTPCKGTTFTVAIPIKLETAEGEKAFVKMPESLFSTTKRA